MRHGECRSVGSFGARRVGEFTGDLKTHLPRSPSTCRGLRLVSVALSGSDERTAALTRRRFAGCSVVADTMVERMALSDFGRLRLWGDSSSNRSCVPAGTS